MLRRILFSSPSPCQSPHCSALLSLYAILRPGSRRFSPGLLRRYATNRGSSLEPPLPLKPSSRRLDERFREFDCRIAQHHGPVELFTAPSHRSYVIGAYSLATFCYCYTGYNAYITVFDPVAGVGRLEGILLGGACLVTAMMGTVFLSRGSNLISSITATRSQGQTQLLVRVRRMVPFLRQREIAARPSQMSLSNRLVVPLSQHNSEGWKEAQRQLENQRALEKKNFFKAPISKISFAVWRIFMNARRLFTQEHFLHLKIDGQKGSFRLDTTGEMSQHFFHLEKGMIHNSY